jgi:hypothetical protein
MVNHTQHINTLSSKSLFCCPPIQRHVTDISYKFVTFMVLSPEKVRLYFSIVLN